MALRRALIFGWIMFLLSEVMVGIGVKNLLDEDDDWKNHALFMTVSMVYVNGHGMLIFRLFPDVRTRVIKFIHALIHTAAAGIAIYAYVLIADADKQFSPFHGVMALTTAIAFGLEWLSAVLVFLYMYSNQARRKIFSGWHNFFGICVLQLSIATTITMIQEIHHEDESNTSAGCAIISLVVYGVLVNVIVLNPYVEWRLVGPI